MSHIIKNVIIYLGYAELYIMTKRLLRTRLARYLTNNIMNISTRILLLMIALASSGCSQVSSPNDLVRDQGSYATHQELQFLQEQFKIADKIFSDKHYVEYIVLQKQLIERMESTLGNNFDELLALNLFKLAYGYGQIGNYDEEVILINRGLELDEKLLNEDKSNKHVSKRIISTMAENQGILALLDSAKGNFNGAISLYKCSIEKIESTIGHYCSQVANLSMQLGGVYFFTGDYSNAKTYYERSLEINERIYRKDAPEMVGPLNALGELYAHIGDYLHAKKYYNHSLEIIEKYSENDHKKLSSTLHGLAMVYEGLEDYKTAELYFLKALAIREKESKKNGFGDNSVDLAPILTNIGKFYYKIGDFSKAESFHKRALGIWEKSDIGSYNIIHALDGLALINKDKGEYGTAALLYERCLKIEESLFGKESYLLSYTLDARAKSSAARGDFSEALNDMLRGQHVNDAFINNVMSFTPENQQMAFVASLENHLYSLLTLVSQNFISQPRVIKETFNVWLKRKGLVLETQKRLREAFFYSDDPYIAKLFDHLADVRTSFSKLIISGPSGKDHKAFRQRGEQLESEIQSLEDELAKYSTSLVLDKKKRMVDCDQVAKALPKASVLIEFARTKNYNFKARGKESKWLPEHYLAFILHAGDSNHISLIDLGDASTIENVQLELNNALAAPPEKQLTPEQAQTTSRLSAKLYELIYKPLVPALRDSKEIFISPDGVLNLIPFEILITPSGRYLIQDVVFNYLAAGRDVLGFGQFKNKVGKSILIGNPDYNLDAELKEKTVQEIGLKLPAKPQSTSLLSRDLHGFFFEDLPKTQQEVETIQTILGVDKAQLFVGKEALEEVLTSIVSPRILHLATHGFFLPNQEPSSIFENDSHPPIFDNPLIRSGIAMAGANMAVASNQAKEGDGIFTAEKVLALKLQGTELVVLSACQSGLGEVKTGEGVFGLRRAFSQAGAKSMIMSMWSVPDEETKNMMETFYKNYVTDSMDRSHALNQAILQEMEVVRSTYGHTNPYFWGAFVFSGEP